MLRIDVQTSREALSAGDLVQLLYLLVRISPEEQFWQTDLPLNLCLVIDRSTSMQGERLDTIKRAAALLLDHLAPRDVLSIVAFSDRANVVLPASHIQNKTPVLTSIRSLTAYGGTELYHGLTAGLSEMRKADLKRHLNHLILFTDGQTYGDEKACLQLAQRAAGRHIGLSGFGIGSDWNDTFLDQLVAPSGGQSAYIEVPSEILTYLEARLDGLGSVVAQNLRLELDRLPTDVQVKAGLKMSPYSQPLPIEGGRPLSLGHLEGQVPLTYLLELSVGPQAAGTPLLIPLHHRGDVPRHQVFDQAFTQSVTLSVQEGANPLAPSPELLEAVNVLNLCRINELAWQAADEGHLDLATTRLRHLTTRLLQSGHVELAQMAQQEIARVTAMESLSDDGRKRLKFGTRALFVNGHGLRNHD